MDSLRRLPGLGVEALFQELEDRHAEDLPGLTLLLASGRSLRGRLVRFERTHLLLAGEGNDVTYLPLASVEGVTVHYTPQTMALLSQGRLPRAREHAPTRLEIRRRLQEIGGQLDFSAFPEDDLSLSVLDELVGDLIRIFAALRGDEEGRAALESVQAVQIRPDPRGPDVVRDGSTVTVQTGTLEGRPSRLAAEDLRRALERVL